MGKLRGKIAKAGIEHRIIKSTLRMIFVKIPVRIHNWFKEEFKFSSIQCHINYVRRKNKTEKKTILFVTFRNTYDCNPRAICQEIIDQKLPYRLVQVARKIPANGHGVFPKEVKLVVRDSYEFYTEAAKAKILIDNSINLASMHYKKKPDQILIETWHGAIGMKRFDTSTNKKWVKKALKEAKLTDYCISNSKFETDLYKSTLWPNAEILEYGHPRNDILFEQNPDEIDKIKKMLAKKYKFDVKKRICLYAPTFRDDKDITPYSLPYEKLMKALKDRFGGDWIILTRFHQRVKALLKDFVFPEGVYNVSEFHDIQDICVVTDVAITDYSSWICEYLLTGRPGFLFATDADHYIENERELVYPLDSTPFPLAKNITDLLTNIKRFDNDLFLKKREEFLDKYKCYDDGYASKRTVEKIKQLLGD